MSEKTQQKHIVKIKKEPIWLKANFVGKYNGIRFRFKYKEYNNFDAEDVIRSFSFTWPGAVPGDKKFAERGIKALFMEQLDSESPTVSMKVIKDNSSSTEALLGEDFNMADIEAIELNQAST